MPQRRGPKVVIKHEEEMELRRGPWTLEEDTLLMNYIACHGEGRWNLLARCSGLKRTGKSCRLRWLNYLKPDIKRGNLTPEEQLLILELHAKWGNRWSRIAQHLPGRTDNEIKNYWRTRVQKQARQLKVDANSAVFRDAVRCYWMPRLLEKMAAPHQAHDHSLRSIDHSHSMIISSSSMNQVDVPVYSHHQQRSMDPSPSTSSGSTALPLLPYFSESSSGAQAGELTAGDIFADPALGGLGLDDGLEFIGPDWSDSTLLDYLNSTCGSAMTSTSNHCGMMDSMVGDYSTVWRTDELMCQGRKLGEWGGI